MEWNFSMRMPPVSSSASGEGSLVVTNLCLVSILRWVNVDPFPPGGIMSSADNFVDIRRGEILLGFYVRAGAWIDGIEILTSLGRKSGIYGNAQGGSG